MEIKFQAGDQVVAVPLYGVDWSNWLKKGFNVPYPGCVYTVRELYLSLDCSDRIGCRLVEVVNKSEKMSDGTIDEIGWDAREFQPVKKTDISSFKKMERPNKPKFITKEPERVKEKV